ncbi:MAG: matrixin family metalloprotease [bacterium]
MTRRRMGTMSRAALFISLVLGGVGSAAEPASHAQLVSERRDGYTRELQACGRRKACVRKPTPDDSDASSATSSRAVPQQSRWAEAQYDHLRVWIAPGSDLPGWRERNRYLVRDAFHEWTAAGAPVRFTFVSDSAKADVKVLWRRALPNGRAGQVTRLADEQGWLRAATIELSTHDMAGGAQNATTMHAVSLHEVGHLLGLEHSDNEHDIMAPWVTARALTPRDRVAMQTLYGVAPRADDTASLGQ